MLLKDLTRAPYNPRKITDRQLDALGKSMRTYGDLSGIVVNIQTGNMISGHQRVKNLDPAWGITKHAHTDSTGTTALGSIQTPFGQFSFREVNWSEKKEKAANISANKCGGYFDTGALKEILLEIDDGATDMGLTGFSQEELENLLVGEVEIDLADRTAEEVIEALSAKIRKVASENPRQMNSALAVILNNGRGNAVLFLADPCTADIIKELRRYADAGEHSPLDALVRALL